MSINLKIYKPDTITKQLKIQSCTSGRKLVISTNFLNLYGFEKDIKIKEEVIAENKGFIVRFAKKQDIKTKKVYQRTYKSRRNNPLETMLDIRGQELLNKAIPKNITNVHITFKHGVITIIPIENKIYDSIKKFRELKNPLQSMLICSSGIDGYALQKNQFTIKGLLEFRPQESRDKQNFEETGVINALANLDIQYVFNEDIYKIDIDRMLEVLGDRTIPHLSISLQCDDFSNGKAASLKNKSIDDLSTTIDMFIDCINIITRLMPLTILIENVKEFKDSIPSVLLKTRLKRLGYDVYDEVHDARDFNSLCRRTRNYLFATILPFEYKSLPKPEKQNISLWNDFIKPLLDEDKLRDVSHCKSFQDGIRLKRARIVDEKSIHFSTVLKSQMRMAKDSIVISHNDKLYFPDNELLKKVMSIPEEFNFDGVGQVIQSEIIGQGVEFNMHEAIVKHIKNYLEFAHARLNNRLF